MLIEAPPLPTSPSRGCLTRHGTDFRLPAVGSFLTCRLPREGHNREAIEHLGSVAVSTLRKMAATNLLFPANLKRRETQIFSWDFGGFG